MSAPGLREAGAGRPLILLHGWTMEGAVFDAQIARLAPRFHVLAPDLAGHGAARGLSADLDSAAGQLDRLIAARGLRDVLLVGWSMGAQVAWSYLRDHGGAALAGLVSVDMSPRMINDADWRLGLIGQEAADVAATSERFARDWTGGVGAIAATMFADRDGPHGFDAGTARKMILRQDADAMRRMWASLSRAELRDSIARIDVPFLALFGEKSRVYPAGAAHWLAQQAPRGRAQGLANSGHSPHLEEPAAFAAALEEFAATL